MQVQLPITFELPIDERALQDIQIDFGAGDIKHSRELRQSLTKGAFEAFVEKMDAREKLWSLLDQNIQPAPEWPARLKPLLSLCVFCHLFGVRAEVGMISLNGTNEKSTWTVQISLNDSKGRLLGDEIEMSLPADPSDYRRSLDVFFGAVIEAVRVSVRGAFGIHEAYDEQDVR